MPQKGIDLTIAAIQALLSEGAKVQLVCLGSGEAEYERELQVLRARFPGKVGVTLGYNEKLAHQIEAGVDAFLMPSRFEPCGLNQLYSLRYGTLPVVRNTGGLADSVVDAEQAGLGTGFKFEAATSAALFVTLKRAGEAFKQPEIWQQMQITAMETHSS